MPIRFYLIMDHKTQKVDVLKVEGDGPNMSAYVSPPDPGEPKDEIPSKLKKKIEDEKKKIN